MTERPARPPFADRSFEAPSDAPLDRLLRDAHPGASWSSVRQLIETGKVTVDGQVSREPARPVRRGSAIALTMRAARPRRDALAADAIAYSDAHVVVVKKPAGLSSVPFDERETDSLLDRLEVALRRGGSLGARLGVVHRLDKETSGVLVFARTLAAKRALKNEFRFHAVHRRYVALAHGDVKNQTLSSRLVQDRGDGRRGSTENPKLGRASTTHVRALERLGRATLIECRLETGRTHQIRIHLAERGHPLIGERVYGRDFAGPWIDAPRLMLHARELAFVHPATGERMSFEDPPPDDMRLLLEALRQR